MAVMEIDGFMKREFGPRGIKILTDIYDRLGIDDIESASEDQKKRFVAEIQPEFRSKSLARSGVLTSEVMSIIGLREDTTKGVAFQKVDQEYVKKYISTEGYTKLKSIYAKIEAIFNLFWINASEAFQKGVSKPIIHKVTDQILQGVKNDLHSICEEIELKFNLTAKKNRLAEKEGFDLTGAKIRSVEEAEEPLEIIFNEFKDKIDRAYQEFHKTFMETLDKDIEMKKLRKDDRSLREETKLKTKEVWTDIIEAYDELRRKVNSLEDQQNGTGNSTGNGAT